MSIIDFKNISAFAIKVYVLTRLYDTRGMKGRKDGVRKSIHTQNADERGGDILIIDITFPLNFLKATFSQLENQFTCRM